MSNCVRCGGKTMVHDSRPTATSDLRRRRRCTQCGFRFTTLEIPTTTHPRAKEIAEWAAEEARRIYYDEQKAETSDPPPATNGTGRYEERNYGQASAQA